MGRAIFSLPFAVKAILFDLDDTLYDRDQVYADWARTFVRTAFPIADSAGRQAIIDLLVELDNHGYALREPLFAQLLSHYPELTIPHETLVKDYQRDFLSTIQPVETTTRLLRLLAEFGIPFGIITNGSHRQQQKIVQLEIDSYTSCVFISRLFGVEKPDATIFLAAAKELQVAPEEVLFVGDHPYNDIWGAHQVGMRTAWLPRAYPWPAELPRESIDLTLTSLTDLLSFETFSTSPPLK